jgi:hypothetical protein
MAAFHFAHLAAFDRPLTVTTGFPYPAPGPAFLSAATNPCFLAITAVHEATQFINVLAACQKCKAKYDELVNKYHYKPSAAANAVGGYFDLWVDSNRDYLECQASKAGYYAALAGAAVACTSGGCPSPTPCCAGFIQAAINEKQQMNHFCPRAHKLGPIEFGGPSG